MAPTVLIPELDRARALAEQALAWNDPTADIELEAALKVDVSPAEFARVLSSVAAFPGACPGVETVQLDCPGPSRRWEFMGEDRIRAFLRRGNSVGPAADRVLEKRTAGATVKLSEYPIVLRLKSERVLPSKGTIVPNSDSLPMRLKRRVSVSFPADHVRVDMTAVMSGTGDIKRSRSFEIEVEALPGKDTTADELVRCILGYAHACYCALRGTTEPLSETEVARYKSAYDALTGNSRRKVGPNPVTLTRSNLQPPGPGVVSVLEGYTVTAKFDGERSWLFVSDGNAVLIDSRDNMVRVARDVPKALDGTLLDGEFLTRSKIDTPLRFYGIFDAYWVSGRSVAALPLMSQGGNKSRLSAAADVVAVLMKSAVVDGFTAAVKDFVILGDKYSERVAQALADAESLPFVTDGIIFTPAKDAVGAKNDAEVPELTGRWQKALKWKPPSYNSVDFLVRVKRDKTTGGEVLAQRTVALPSGATATVRGKVVTLSAAHNPATWEPIVPVEYIKRGSAAMPRFGFFPKLFRYPGEVATNLSECTIDLVDGRMLSREGDAVEDDTVVEFVFEDERWVPMRVRHDKTERYVKTGTIEGTANEWGTALAVFSSIRNPVTIDMVAGRVPTPPLPDDDAVYFVEKSSKDLKAMRNFHNLFVKGGLYDKFGVRGGSLLEFACGRGGDISRWLRKGFSLIVGLDKALDGIVNPARGMYSGWEDATARMSTKPRAAFLTLDATTRMFAPHDELVAAAAETGDSELVQALWGLPGNAVDPALEPYKGVMTRGFDTVSCQFSIHYMFETSSMLDRFIANVARMTKPGGVFIGTTFDGDLVAAGMGSKGMRGTVGAREQWTIKPAGGSDLKKFRGETGVAVDVFVSSIGKVAREYLVGFRTLVSRMERAGFVLEETELFKDAHARAVATKTLPAPLSASERGLSFLYRSFAFRKK